MIEIEELTRTFGTRTAVDRLTLTIGEGEVFALLGPNGAGKTTTVRMLGCLIGRTSGRAVVAGQRIGDPGADRRIRGLIGLLPEEPGLYPDLTAVQTLDYFGKLHQLPKRVRAERTEELLTRLGLWERRDSKAATYSKGMRQRLAIARALIHDPPVLFLDEPTANLDPEGARAVREFLLQLRAERRTIVLNTHDLAEAERVCDRVGVLRTRLVAVGSPAELRAQLHGSTTRIRLDAVTDPVLAAVRALHPEGVRADGDTITVAVADPVRENPELVAAVVAAGGRVQSVVPVTASLEEVYLELLGEEKAP
ncbi:ABC transporter ATP-binding protein [Kitasatospora viridis]|uniref:ABC-2 type transport system ATP-binding protein n=1 Tax=Kitasatospora viridis TaxID=281105 RepID=A0A561T798_9ACTN|nr:ABC transporter ATP-binding protein [Kitasatospora viridis]TWF82977.1 ABC-2 type transport system ATP-binding protein [Kitasatospora viridis]